VIRACQLLAQHNETVFNEKVVNFMPDVTVISMDNYNDTTCIVDGNFDGS
jgi:uridine kinase